MRLQDILVPQTIIDDLKVSTKEGVIKELLGVIKEYYRLSESVTDLALEALLRREKLGTTGIGNALAVPHAKLEKFNSGGKSILAAFGRSKQGINFNSIDGSPVQLVFLILGNTAQADEYLKILSLVARAVQQTNLCKFLLKEARNKEDILETIREIDEVLIKL